MSEADRREVQRYRIQRKVVVAAADQTIAEEIHVRDISARGVKITADAQLPQSGSYRVSLYLGEDLLESERGRYIEFEARLVDSVKVDLLDQFRHGLLIVAIEPQYERVLEEYLAERA